MGDPGEQRCGVNDAVWPLPLSSLCCLGLMNAVNPALALVNQSNTDMAA